MDKERIKNEKICCMLLALAMLFSMTACKSTTKPITLPERQTEVDELENTQDETQISVSQTTDKPQITDKSQTDLPETPEIQETVADAKPETIEATAENISQKLHTASICPCLADAHAR